MILEKFLDVVENIEPGLYDVLNGDEARRELYALLEQGTTGDGSVIVSLNGEKLSLVAEMELAPAKYSESECETIPFLYVQSGTIPPKEPLTEPEAG